MFMSSLNMAVILISLKFCIRLFEWIKNDKNVKQCNIHIGCVALRYLRVNVVIKIFIYFACHSVAMNKNVSDTTLYCTLCIVLISVNLS